MTKRDRTLEDIEQCRILCEMAYMGNAGERQALRMIRSILAGLYARLSEAHPPGPSAGESR